MREFLRKEYPNIDNIFSTTNSDIRSPQEVLIPYTIVFFAFLYPCIPGIDLVFKTKILDLSEAQYKPQIRIPDPDVFYISERFSHINEPTELSPASFQTLLF